MAQTLGTVLRERRKSRGLTQQAIAKALKVTRAAVGQWEAGTHEPSTENLIAVCKLLDLDVSRAVRGEIGEIIDGLKKNLGPYVNEMEKKNPSEAFNFVKSSFQGLFDESIKPGDEKISHHLSKKGPQDYSTVIFNRVLFQMPRPKRLYGNSEAYCFRLTTNILYPKYEKGSNIYVDPKSIPKIDDYIVVRMGVVSLWSSKEALDPLYGEVCIIGRYVGDDAMSVEVGQHYPAQSLKISITEGVSIQRICDATELIEF